LFLAPTSALHHLRQREEKGFDKFYHTSDAKSLKQASKITTSTFAFSHPFVIAKHLTRRESGKRLELIEAVKDWITSRSVARRHGSFRRYSCGGGEHPISFIKVAPRAKLIRLTRVGPETGHFLIPLEGI